MNSNNNESEIQSVLDKFYEIISGEAGRERNWIEFKSLFFSDDSSLASMKYNADNICITKRLDVETYIEGLSIFLRSKDFYEYGFNYEIKEYGNIASVYSEYEAKIKKDDTDIIKSGINIVQFIYGGSGWKIYSMLWEDHR